MGPHKCNMIANFDIMAAIDGVMLFSFVLQ